MNADLGRLVGNKKIKAMKKFVLTALVLCMGFVAVKAQITTGESSAQVIRTGNRAEAGNFGLYLGGTTTIFKNLAEGFAVEGLPLINFKYMLSDKLEARIGLEWWAKSATQSTDGENEKGDFETKNQVKETSKFLSPGFAYHFSNSNVLDVYVGAEVPFGWGGNTTTVFANYDGDDYDVDDTKSTSTFKIGLGAFVGLQAYIANLPLALGVEYGISSLKNVDSQTVVLDEEQEYEMKTSVGDWTVGQQVRLTLTYFFKM